MRTVLVNYPRLSQYFKSEDELAEAGRMKRTKVSAIVTGKMDFTWAEKKAIAANIIARMYCGELKDTPDDLIDMVLAFQNESSFDTLFKPLRKEKSA